MSFCACPLESVSEPDMDIEAEADIPVLNEGLWL
jgi:hypothetical protein